MAGTRQPTANDGLGRHELGGQILRSQAGRVAVCLVDPQNQSSAEPARPRRLPESVCTRASRRLRPQDKVACFTAALLAASAFPDAGPLRPAEQASAGGGSAIPGGGDAGCSGFASVLPPYAALPGSAAAAAAELRASRRALRRALRHWSCGHRRWRREKNGKMWREERREEGRGRGKEMAAEAGRWRRGGSDGAKDGLGRAGRIQGRSRILVSGACQVKPAHRLCPPHLTCPCTHVSLARNALRAKDEGTDGAIPSGGGICWLPGQGQGLSRREIRRARLGRDRTEYTDAKQLQKQKLQRYCHVHDRHGLFPA